jgi:hypothetical protein
LEFRTDVKGAIFSRAQAVAYSDEYPQLGLRYLVDNQHIRDATAWMLTKSSHWSYEREWRILDFENGPGVRKFLPECLSAVILGCCIPADEREKVLDWIRQFPTAVEVRQAKRSATQFRLEIVELQDAARTIEN